MTASRPNSEAKLLTQREWRISTTSQRVTFTSRRDFTARHVHLAAGPDSARWLLFLEIFLSVEWHGCLGSPWIFEREGGNKSLGRWGRISVDRSSKATLPLTIPRPIFKSSAKDSSPRSSEIECKAPTPVCSAGAGELSTHASGGACAPLLVVG